MNNIDIGYVITFVLLAYVTLLIIGWKYIQVKKAATEKKKNEFMSALIKSLESSAIHSLKDVQDLYLAHFGLEDILFVEHDKIGLFLRKIKLHFSTHPTSGHLTRKDLLEHVNSLLLESESEVKKEKEKAPFMGVPTPERNYLEDILEITKPEDKALYKQRLDDLAASIKVRQETTETLTKEQSDSLNWTKRGLYATIIFSAISIGLTVWLSGIFNIH